MIRRPPRSKRTDTLSLHDALPICRAAIFIVADIITAYPFGAFAHRLDDLLQRLVALLLLPEDADVRARAGVLIDHAVGIAGRRVLLPAFGEGDGKAAFHIHIVARFGGDRKSVV